MRRALLFRVPITVQAASGMEGYKQQEQQKLKPKYHQGSCSNANVYTQIQTNLQEDSVKLSSTKAFWSDEAKEVTLHDLKRRYANDRFVDKKTRFVVRQRVREDGVTSNLFPLHINPTLELFSYEIVATRRIFHTKPTNKEKMTTNKTNNSSSSSSKSKSRRKKDVVVVEEAETNTNTTTATTANITSIVRRVDERRAWIVVQRFLRRCVPEAPPLVNVRNKVYSTAPLPTKALELPPEYLDMGWEGCKVRFVGKAAMSKMSPNDVQEVTNKIVSWALRQETQEGKKFSVGRESNGKIVCTHDCISVSGLRIFKGTILRAVFVDVSGATEESTTPVVPLISHSQVPTTAVLTTLTAGHHTNTPLRFLVKEFIREFEFKETPVQSYRIEDGSGVTMASLWNVTKSSTLSVGVVYEVVDYHVRVFESRGGMRLVEMKVGETTFKVIKEEEEEEEEKKKENAACDVEPVKKRRRKHGKDTTAKEEEEEEEEEKEKRKGKKKQTEEENTLKIIPDIPQETTLSSLPGELVLKIDTKCTVAVEVSLWEEVKQHFGSGPYDSATEERIARSVQGTPVVIAATLRHSTIRFVRFNITPTETDLDPALQRFVRELDAGQPYAVLVDYTVVPLQALHCCYDPRMKSWQDIVVTACSFLPARRLDILELFRTALQSGLQQWGITLAAQPLSSKSLSLLPAPQRATAKSFGQSGERQQQQQRQGGKFKKSISTSAASSPSAMRHPPPASFPTTFAVVAIAPSHMDEAELTRTTQTAHAMARYFRTTTTITVPDEKEAVRFLVQQLTNATDGVLKDPNTVVIIISGERETRPSRWVLAECLTRGILAVFMPPASSPKRQNLLCENARARLRMVFETDTLRGINVAREVPAVAQRRVLIVGIDACHTTTFSTGAVVGILCTSERNHLLPLFWKHESRGQEVDQVEAHFRILLQKASDLYGGVDEVVIFQDGDVYSEMPRMQAHIPPGCGFTFMCLHKRTNVRFVHQSKESGGVGNVVKGAVVQALTPIALDNDEGVLPSFFLQNHDCNMSTARTVQYTIHSVSPTLDVSDVQQLSFVLSHVLATQSTKLPMSTRCAHRLASVAERLLDAAPPLQYDMIPAPLNERLWFF
ncbi:argonaute-like protein [Trypanosoma theileri]|uniref:Argonaute-like protein n=1 Tax=Trypanosoma theileri TaxID=67003 RepID=A0A1X0NXV2_9TRYP|nr:argonaute-like protein [Trypanosoma theileri]ORC89378.1 argonaute-like protein [Trypanosoma theileri]